MTVLGLINLTARRASSGPIVKLSPIGKIAKSIKKMTLDDASKAHLEDVQRRLRKALDAEFQQR